MGSECFVHMSSAEVLSNMNCVGFPAHVCVLSLWFHSHTHELSTSAVPGIQHHHRDRGFKNKSLYTGYDFSNRPEEREIRPDPWVLSSEKQLWPTAHCISYVGLYAGNNPIKELFPHRNAFADKSWQAEIQLGKTIRGKLVNYSKRRRHTLRRNSFTDRGVYTTVYEYWIFIEYNNIIAY